MATSAVMHFWVYLVVFGLTIAGATSSHCISCPCGSSGQNYTQCFPDSLMGQYNCERWANCQTCSENTNFCTSCPPYHFGETCSEVCGRIPQLPNRRSGSPSRPGDWPWTMGIAALSREDAENVFCGGVILDETSVLTAAQCVTGAPNVRLLFGTAHPTATGDSGSEQKRRISRAIVHPDFDNETKANDIAVLKFEPALNFSQTIQPICLPESNTNILYSGQEGLVPGWGYDYTLYMTIPAVKYQVANVSVQPDDTCLESCKIRGLTSCSTPKTFCTDYPQGVDACMYRGAPMVIRDKEMDNYSLAGFVTRKLSSGERNCRRGEISTIMTNISYFMPFIRQNLS